MQDNVKILGSDPLVEIGIYSVKEKLERCSDHFQRFTPTLRFAVEAS